MSYLPGPLRFKDDTARERAEVLYSSFILRFRGNIGRAISLTRSCLNTQYAEDPSILKELLEDPPHIIKPLELPKESFTKPANRIEQPKHPLLFDPSVLR